MTMASIWQHAGGPGVPRATEVLEAQHSKFNFSQA